MALSRRGAAVLAVIWAMDLPVGCGLNPRPGQDFDTSNPRGADAGATFGGGGDTGSAASGGASSIGGFFGAGGGVPAASGGKTGAAGGPAADAGMGAGGGLQGAGGASGAGGSTTTGIPLDAGSSDGGPDGGSTPSPDGATHGDAGDGG